MMLVNMEKRARALLLACLVFQTIRLKTISDPAQPKLAKYEVNLLTGDVDKG